MYMSPNPIFLLCLDQQRTCAHVISICGIYVLRGLPGQCSPASEVSVVSLTSHFHSTWEGRKLPGIPGDSKVVPEPAVQKPTQ